MATALPSQLRRASIDGLTMDIRGAEAEHREFTVCSRPVSRTVERTGGQLRAVVAGLVIGTLSACTNMSLGLQSGWVSASLLGFAVFKVLPRMPWFSKKPLTIHENVRFVISLVYPQDDTLTCTPRQQIVLQTTAVATGTLPLAAGFVGVIPALAQLTPSQDRSPPLILSWHSLLAWSFAVAFFGVFLAVPLRRQVIVKEQLTFPSGTATAQVIGVLHGKPLQIGSQAEDAEDVRRRRAGWTAGYEQLQADEVDEDELEGIAQSGKIDKVVDSKAWTALSLSFAASTGFTLLSFAFPVLYAIPVFDIGFHAAHDWLWWFTPSFSYIGQGIIMGFPTTASMNLGMLCGWAILSPLSHYSGWAPGPVSSSINGARGWILWPALAIMCAESVMSLGLVAVSALQPWFRHRTPSALFVSSEAALHRRDSLDSVSSTASSAQPAPIEEDLRAEDEPPLQLVLLGVALSCISCVVLVAYVFGEDGIRWWATIVALILASAFSILGVRALGETDLNPVSAIGKISQLVFAVIQPNNVIANLVAGGISEAGAQQAGDLMQDLKTGYLWKASPRAQFRGQMIGSFASVFVSTTLYCLYRRAYELPSTNFPVPTAAIWFVTSPSFGRSPLTNDVRRLNLARLVNRGELPPRSKEAMLLFGGTFVVLASLKAVAKARTGDGKGSTWARYIPSGIAFAIGFINTPSFSLARLVGGLISLYYTRQRGSARSVGPTHRAAHLEHFGLIIVASGFVLGEGLSSVIGLLLKMAGTGGPLSCYGCGVGGGGYCGGGC
ncbi:SPOSA6832_04344, partial [Sporobolomyces salmonicolor]